MTTGALATKLVRVGKALGWIEKRGKNKDQGYAYVQAVDIFVRVRAELAIENVAFTWSVTDHHHDVVHRDNKSPQFTAEIAGDYSFIDGDTGDVITGRFVGFGIDTSGKALWAAQTGALKYVFIGNFLLPTGDDPEATEHGGETAAPAVRNGSSPVPPTATKVTDGKISTAQVVKLKASLGDAGLKSDAQKLQFVSAILGHPISAKQMTSDQMDQVLAAIAEQPLVLAAAVELA